VQKGPKSIFYFFQETQKTVHKGTDDRYGSHFLRHCRVFAYRTDGIGANIFDVEEILEFVFKEMDLGLFCRNSRPCTNLLEKTEAAAYGVKFAIRE